MGIHDHLKLVKHGYSKVTDHACREIRHGRMTRDQAIRLVGAHAQAEPPHVDLFCEWLGIDRRALQFIVDTHRNPAFWTETEPGRWMPRPTVTALGAEAVRADEGPGFRATSTLDFGRERRYVTVGKGYPL